MTLVNRTANLPPIWVANLERSIKRSQFMQRQLEAMGLAYNMISAVDGKTLTASDLQKYSAARALTAKGRELSPGEIGCALTHANMYQRMIEAALDEVLILEDDVVITQNLLEVLYRRKAFPADWEIINFANTYARPIRLGEPLFERHHLCKFQGIANRTSAYLINLRGAKKLLANVYPIRLPADDLIGRTHIAALNLYGIAPPVVRLKEFASDIWDYHEQWQELRHANIFARWLSRRFSVRSK